MNATHETETCGCNDHMQDCQIHGTKWVWKTMGEILAAPGRLAEGTRPLVRDKKTGEDRPKTLREVVSFQRECQVHPQTMCKMYLVQVYAATGIIRR